MLKYSKPQLLKFRDDEIMDMIVAGASCPNCYQGGTFTTNNCQGASVLLVVHKAYMDPCI